MVQMTVIYSSSPVIYALISGIFTEILARGQGALVSIEGLGPEGQPPYPQQLDPLTRDLVLLGGLQCGYCCVFDCAIIKQSSFYFHRLLSPIALRNPC